MCFEEKTAKARVYLGYLLNKQGKHEKAIKELKLALKINPDLANERSFQEHLRNAESKLKH